MKQIPLRGFVAIGASLAVAALALLPGAWGTALAQTTPPPPPPAQVTITVVVNDEEQTIVTTPGGLATVELPAGSQITSITVTVTTTPGELASTTTGASIAVAEFLETTPSVVAGLEVGYVFEILFGGNVRAIGAGGPALVMDHAAVLQMSREVLQTTGPVVLPTPAVARLNLLPETLAQVGGDLSRISVILVDPATGIIETMTMLPSPGPGQIAFEFTKQGAYAIMVNPITVGDIGVPAPANTGIAAADSTSRGASMWMLAGLGAVALAAGGGALAYRRTR
ncbi:MAG: hypothetical protein AMXMBFR23_01480 [Chloroflexota bacterium]